MTKFRNLHYVLKMVDRRKTMNFYQKTLGMTLLRHEEFKKECEASCNGPYNGMWSKTMIGYGAEDNHFVIELVYNYEVSGYKVGNDLKEIIIEKKSVFDAVQADASLTKTVSSGGNCLFVKDPCGYTYHIYNRDRPSTFHDPVVGITLLSSNLQKTKDYWQNICQLKLDDVGGETNVISGKYADDQAEVRFQLASGAIDRGSAFGRTAISCDTDYLPGVNQKALDGQSKLHSPHVVLKTPNKADVVVVILQDPDDHEICLVGDEGFRELSTTDAEAQKLLDAALQNDDSDAWFQKKNIQKEVI